MKVRNRRLGFDTPRFNIDLLRVLTQRKVNKRAACKEIGIGESVLYNLASARNIPGSITLAAICRWASIDVRDYVIDREAA